MAQPAAAGEETRGTSEAQLRSVLDGALDAVLATDAGGAITYWSPQAEKTFGWTPEEAVGRRCVDLVVVPEHGRDLERLLAGSRTTTPPKRMEAECLRKDGERFPAELSITGVRVDDAATRYVFVRDLAERRQAEEERNRLLEKAREVGRTKDEFVALLSHELRTPLSAIVGWAHMLRTGDLDEATQRRAIETIDRNAKAQNQLIEDILDVSRIVAGKFHVEMRSVDLARVVKNACETVGPLAAAKKVALEVDVSAPLPLTVGDPDRLQQVAWNLLSNAVKFTPVGGKVTVDLARAGDVFELTVRDTGTGIDPEFLPQLFERFRPGASGAKRQQGLGLGLSIVKHIIEVHGGTVVAASAGAGQGATFTVRLPVTDAAADKVPPVGREQGDAMASAPRLDGLSVLVVDDEADARDLIAAVLEGRGAAVLSAGSAAEAIGVLQAERPDLVLSDISMRDEDGYDFIKKVRALPAGEGGRTPAAALTAYGRLEDRMRALSAGFQLHVAKPVDPAELVAVVATLGGRT